jgi:hypothetical protein
VSGVENFPTVTGETPEQAAERMLPEPEPLPVRPTAPAFPIDALPGWCAAYVEALATTTQTPPDLAGACVLGVLAACAGGRAVVEARPGWREPVNLYLLPVLDSASRKSAVVAATTAPVYEVERHLAAQAQPQRAEALAWRDIADRAAQEARRKAAKADSDPQRAKLTADAVSAAATAEAITVPATPRLLADDATPEAVGTLLAEQDGRLAIISAEGGLFDLMAGRYSRGIPNLDVWLKGHAGDTLRVDRKGRPPEYVARPALTLLLTVQPAVLAAIARHGAFTGRGLLARFLYSLPPDNVGYRDSDPPPIPAAVDTAYREHVHQLAERMLDWTDPAVLMLNADARALLLDIDRRHEPRLRRDDGDLAAPGLREWAGKRLGATLRLAGLLHLAADDENALFTPISAQTLAAANRLADYFTEHARAAFGLLGDTTGIDNARYLLDHLHRHHVEQFTLRQLLTNLPRSRFATAEDVSTAVAVLEEHHHVLALPPPPRTGPGRAPSPAYQLNPRQPTPPAQSAQPAQPPPNPDSAGPADIAPNPDQATRPFGAGAATADSAGSADTATPDMSGPRCQGCRAPLPPDAEICAACYREGDVA